MRLASLLVLCLLPAAPAAAAGPPLVGTPGNGAVRLLDRDLNPIAGTPRLPRGTDGTVRSPDGKRFATWAFARGTISVRDARTGAVGRRLKAGGGAEAFWPTRHRIVAVTNERGVNVIRSFDLAHGGRRTLRLAGTPLQVQAAGRITRLLTADGDIGAPSGFTVTDVGAAGRRKRSVRVALPDGMDGDATVRLSGDRLLASQEDRHALIDLAGKAVPLDLAPGTWLWLGKDLIEANGEVVSIDRRSGALGKRVAVDPTQLLTATPDGGFLVGIGSARYGADLERVAANAVPAGTEHSVLVVAGTRFYALAYDCTRLADDYRMVIGSTATGRILAEKPGQDWQVGRLGDGLFPAMSYGVDCE